MPQHPVLFVLPVIGLVLASMPDKDQQSIPSWDGSPKTWRKYHREVAWYVRSTPVEKRRYCAHRLVGKLTGPARLLAMSWPSVSFDHSGGTKEFLRRLASSPLVRQSLPNAAAICQQYFSFKRQPGETMQSFLVRESLGFAEFTEAIIRLYEESRGVRQEDLSFDLPDDEEETEQWYDWWAEEEWWDAPEVEGDPPADASPSAATQPFDTPTRPDSGSPVVRLGPSSPSRKAVSVQLTAAGDISEMSLADSFVLGVLRGFRLLQAAGLNPDEMRDIIGTTKGSLEFPVITRALQTLWDEQLLGRRQHGSSRAHDTFFGAVEEEDETVWADASGGDVMWSEGHGDGDWGWTEDDPSYWDYAASHEQPACEELPVDDEAVKEAQKAEKIAESLAMEAQRTWSEAQRATQALRRDRGFGHVLPPGRPNDGKCFLCNGNHLARGCPDARHPGPRGSWGKGSKGGGKWHHWADYDEAYVMKGKGKGKRKSQMWMEAQAFQKGKPGKGKGYNRSSFGPPRPAVNAYSTDMFALELDDSTALNLHSATGSSALSKIGQSQGLIDCGATASAGPQVAVEHLIQSVLAQDSRATVDVLKSARPYFRFGNGGWGRALYQVVIGSSITGTTRTFRLYALPNPPDLHHPGFDPNNLVPILVGMDHLSGHPSAMLIDFRTGLAMDSHGTSPLTYQLPVTKKGHYVLDVVHYLTQGMTCHDGHAVVRVSEDVQPHAAHTLEFHPTEYYDLDIADHGFESHVIEESRQRLRHVHACSWRQFPCDSSAATASMHLCKEVNPNSQLARDPPDGKILEAQQVRSDGPPGEHSRCDSGQEEAGRVRLRERDADGSTRSPSRSPTVAMLRSACSGHPEVKSPRVLDSLQDLRSASQLLSSQGQSGKFYKGGQSGHVSSHAEATLRAAGRHDPNRCLVSSNAGQSQCRGDLDADGEEGVKPPFQDKSKEHVKTEKPTSPPWEMVKEPPKTLLDDLETHLSSEELTQLVAMVKQRQTAQSSQAAEEMDALQMDLPTAFQNDGYHQ